MYEKCEIDDRIRNGVKKTLSGQGYRIKNGKIRRRETNFGSPPDGPWVFIRGMDNRRCGMWVLYHDNFKFLPEYCATKCWKVVVRVMKIKDLYMLYDIAKALNLPSKVGINARDWVRGPYLGFFYSTSKDEAKQQYDVIKKSLIPHIKEFDILYKQKCTEMEINGFKTDPLLEEKCECMFAPFEDENRTAAWNISLIMDEWERFALKTARS